MENNLQPKAAAESRSEMIRVLRYAYLNSARRLFGGALMQWIDELAGIVALRHCGGEVITAAVDTLVFNKPAFLGDVLVLVGCVTYTGHSSMEVRVDTFVEAPNGERHRINRAYLVMVAIDEDNRPTPAPALQPQSKEELQEWESGKKRSALRKQRRKEKF